MKNLLMSIGKYQFFDEPSNKNGLIGGKITAINSETGEKVSKTYQRFHTGKTTKYYTLGQLMAELAPPEEEKEEVKDDDNRISENEDIS